jgi:hypothetical protein
MSVLNPWLNQVSAPARRRRRRRRIIGWVLLACIALPLFVYGAAHIARLGWGP